MRMKCASRVDSDIRWPLARLGYFAVAALGHLAALLFGAELAVGTDRSLLITISNVVGYGLMLNLIVSIGAFITASIATGLTYMHSVRHRG